MSWVRTKLALVRLEPGPSLEVRVSAGEAGECVPRSAREAGHTVAVEGDLVRIVRS
jgi:TusA-related sulfurtransferase